VERHADHKAAAGSDVRGQRRVVCVGDREHDGEAEPDALPNVRRIGCEPLERLEEPLKLCWRNRRAGVGDDEDGAPRLGAGCDLDAAADQVVADRVRDEVGGEPPDQVRVADRPGRFELKDVLEPAAGVSVERSGRGRPEVDRLATLRPILAPSQCETRLDQPLLSPAGAEDVLADLPPGGHIRIRVGERELEESTLRRERVSQLVRGVGEEPLLPSSHVGRGRDRKPHGLDGREPFDPPRRARAPTFTCSPAVSCPGASLSGVRPKIHCRCEAKGAQSDHNGAVHSVDMGRLAMETRRAFSGRAAHIAPIVALGLVATYEATLPASNGGSISTRTAIVLSVLAVVPLMMGRRWPTFATAAAALLTVLGLRGQYAPLAAGSFCVFLFLLAQLVARRSLLFAAPLLVPLIVVVGRRLAGPHNALGSVAPLLFIAAALVVGESMRRRRVAVAALDATQEAMTESIRARTAMEERARIARELHDIVAHHLSVIAVESEAARLTSPKLSEDAGDRLEAIASTAREALTETRRLLGVLREDTDGQADRAPQPGLGELDDLIKKAQAAGTPIRLTQEGELAGLPRSVDLAAFRIVQEALTNARRHASGANVDVEVSYRNHNLHLNVRDFGPGTIDGEPVAGHGLMGMRERATLAGGTFSAGPARGGGFEVDVTLPVTEPAP